MPDFGYPEAVLIMTTRQWSFLTGRINAGQGSIEGMIEQIDIRLQGTWADDINPDFRTWGDNPNISLYSSVGDSFDIAHNTPGVNVWARATGALPPVVVEQPAPKGPGIFSPLPSPPITPFIPPIIMQTGGQMVPVVGGGLKQLAQKLMLAIGSKLALAGGWRGALASALGVLGVTQIVDIVDQWVPGLGEAEKEKLSAVLEAFAQLEDAGLIHPWNPRARRDGTPAGGPYYMVFDLTQMQGHYTNFHMSRKGLQSHDDKQDTHMRPRRQRRTTRR